MENDSRPTNPGTSPNKMIYYKAERLIQNVISKLKLKRDYDVEELYLANESLLDLPSLEKYKNLSKLWLQNNRIKKLEFIQYNEALSEIYLQNNLIQDIRHCFRNLKNIRVLFLNGNQLYNLDHVLDELSYLKCIESLNLFDNPIALEKNYRNTLVYVLPTLKFLDRNSITKNEHVQSFKMFEKERVQIESGYAFLRCIPKSDAKVEVKPSKPRPKLHTDATTVTKQSNIFTTNSQGLAGLSESQERTFFEEMQSLQETDENEKNRSKNKYQRTVCELSYFDWAKVKLCSNKYQDDELNDAILLQQQQQQLFLKQDDDKNSDEMNEIISNNSKKKIFELPQVLTIRFQ